MKNKILSFKALFSLLLLVMVLSIGISAVSAAPTPLYVNDTSGSDDYDGSSPVVIDDKVGPMKHIQVALDAVADDGEVNVAEGTYTESLVINRNVTLRGSGSSQTTLNPATSDGTAITINAAVTRALISGFTISGAIEGNGIVNYGTGVTISDNNITNNGKGIVIAGASEANITANTITYNKWGMEIASELKDVHFNRIYHNENDIVATSAVDATYNWWGSNNPLEIENVLISPWLYMNFTVDPSIVLAGKTSQLVADFNKGYDGKFLTPFDPAGGHLADGTAVTFTTDLGNVGSKTINIGTVNGVATATLTADEGTGTANVSAQLDQELWDDTVGIINTLYVNGATGDDSYSGTSPTFISGTTGPLKTIQAAINKANAGGIIEIAPGTYYEHLTIGKSLSLNGAGQDQTFIDGSSSGTVIIINSGSPQYVVNISNVTIQNGLSTTSPSGLVVRFCGGGIYNQAILNISNSTIQNNQVHIYRNSDLVSSQGGGIYNSGSLEIMGCVIRSNQAYAASSTRSADSNGGGIYNSGSLEIRDSVIQSNQAESHSLDTMTYSRGGGIYNSGSLEIRDSVIQSNQAKAIGFIVSVYGGGIYNSQNMNITGSIIKNNDLYGDGDYGTTGVGGIYNQLYTSILRANFNCIMDNTQSDIGGNTDNLNAEYNWWGSNNPSSSLPITSWLVLRSTANPAFIVSDATSVISVDLLHDNGILSDLDHPDLYYHDPANGCVPDGIPVTFSTTLGTIGATSTIINGIAQAVLDGGIVSGIADVSSTVDDETVHAFVTVDTVAPNVSADIKTNYYNTDKLVTLSMDELGTIYYTVDGQNPTTSSTKYTGPITLKYTTILRFMGVDLAGNPSIMYMGAYIIDKVAPTVWSNIKGGYYNVTKTIYLAMNEPGTIYYTRDGSTPTKASTIYTTGPITVSATTTLKFIAVDRAGNIAAVNTQKYIIDRTPPKVISTYPKNYATRQSRTATLYLKFSEYIKTSINWSKIYVKNLKTGKKVSISKWIKANVLYIKTKYKRAAYTWYRVYVPYRAIKDRAGNVLVKSYTFKFKTRG